MKILSFLITTLQLFLISCSPTIDPASKPSEEKVKSNFTLGYFSPNPIGKAVEGRPWITDLCIADLDKDGLLDIIICEGRENRISWIRQTSINQYSETVIAENIAGPAHVEASDIDQDGDLDLLVASMGVIFPNTQKIGSVIVLEQTEQQTFIQHTLAKNIHRVTDVQAGDLDNDGDLDLAVAQFGYDQGEIRWMENLGDWNFKSEILKRLSGPIHSPIADFQNNGWLDIVTVFSQEWEEIHVFENQGNKSFKSRSIYGSANEDYGSSGIAIADVNEDDKPDILFSNGDAFDYARPGPRPWHGVQWLENMGEGDFKFHRLGDLPGAYSPIPGDFDNDGDQDIIAVSGFNFWERPDSVSMICFENDGQQNFTAQALALTPTHLIVVEAADMDNDGKLELVTGSFHAYPPYERIARVILWDQ